jgi:hypothetical protein
MQFLIRQDKEKYFWLSPGANHYVVKTDEFHSKARETLEQLNIKKIKDQLIDN